MRASVRPRVVAAAVFIAASASASARAGESARWPDPLRRQRQIVLVEELIGQSLRIGDARYFIHDIEMGRRADGTTLFLAYDFESARGERFRRSRSESASARDVVQAFALDDAFGIDARMLWWVDAQGEAHGTNLAAGEVAVGPGGEVQLPGPERCTLTVQGYCLSETCDGFCRPFPGCECVGRMRASAVPTRCLARGGYSCEGPCGVGQCQREPVMKGCTCQ